MALSDEVRDLEQAYADTIVERDGLRRDLAQATDTIARQQAELDACRASHEPPPPPVSPWRAVAGVHVLQQVPGGGASQSKAQALSQLAGLRPAILNACGRDGVTHFSLRVAWAHVHDDQDLLDAGKALADEAGVGFAIRFMAGRHTPRVVLDRCRTLTGGDGRYPAPFNPDGSANAPFMEDYERFIRDVWVRWGRENGVKLFHLSHFAEAWAEIAYNPQVQTLAGSRAASADALVRHTVELVRIGLDATNPDEVVELSGSGHGPVMAATDNPQTSPDGIVERIIAGIMQLLGSDRYLTSANGWREIGVWGQPDMDRERRLDRALRFGAALEVQMIQPYNTYNWQQVFAMATAKGATVAEIYLPSWTGGTAAQLWAEAARWEPRLPS